MPNLRLKIIQSNIFHQQINIYLFIIRRGSKLIDETGLILPLGF